MSDIITIDNVIIGAGPAGLQLGYFFEKNSIDYVILERNKCSGSFFEKYPHSKKLISINKKHTGNDNKDYNLRHDWNSLLNDEDMLFNNYSSEFYPKSDKLFEYLNDYSKKFNLKINYEINVLKVHKKNDMYYIKTDEKIYVAKKLIIATGLSLPSIPKCKIKVNNKNNIKHYSEFEKDFFCNKDNLEIFKNKTVYIVGSGNSSLELGNLLNEYTSNIFIAGRHRELSIITHYVGDVRTIYMPFYETFYLKTQNAFDIINIDENYIIEEILDNKNKNYGKYCVKSIKNDIIYDKSIPCFDYIIFCTGWKFDNSIFENSISIMMDKKYPKITGLFESVNNENLFFIGALGHSFDFRKSSGGFIHGFRYLIEYFVRINYKKLVPDKIFSFDKNFEECDALANHMLNRINTSSALYQLFDYMVDIFYLGKDNKIHYYENMSNKSIFKNGNLPNINGYYCVLKLSYGEIIKNIYKIGEFNRFNPSLIHPEIEKYSFNNNLLDKIILEENLVADFSNNEIYFEKIKRTLKYFML